MGRLDQALRIIIGSALIYLGPVSGTLPNDTLSAVLISTIALLAISSALAGWCMIYYAAGIKTN